MTDTAKLATPADLARKRALLAKEAKSHRLRFVRIGLMVAAFLAGIFALTRDRSETEVLSFPADANGERDAQYWFLRNDAGRALFEFEIPRGPALQMTEAKDGTGFTAVSRLGRDRDVPYVMSFAAERDEQELQLDLLSSARRWFRERGAANDRWIGYDAEKDVVDVRFFEDVYPWMMQEKTGYGLPFVRMDYKRLADDGSLMRGIAFYFRCGDVRYVYRREVPDVIWSRAQLRLQSDPGMLVYSAYARAYWESPGNEALPKDGRSVEELLAKVRQNLSADRAGYWNELHRDIDAVLVRSWRTDAKSREIAFGCLSELREAMRAYYWGKSNAYRDAKWLKDGDKLTSRARSDAKAVFTDRSLRYWNMVNAEEDW